jgi:hypothetical protein
MARRVVLFCEDSAHESFATAIVGRLAREVGVDVSIQVGSSRAGIPRLKQELTAFARVLRRSSGLPDLLVILIDANAAGERARRDEIEGAIDIGGFPHVVVGVPDPHVECWYLADPVSFAEAFGPQPAPPGEADCKRRLVEALENADEIVTAGGAEFAEDIVNAMDLFRAGRAVASLKRFGDELTAALRSLA